MMYKLFEILSHVYPIALPSQTHCSVRASEYPQDQLGRLPVRLDGCHRIKCLFQCLCSLHCFDFIVQTFRRPSGTPVHSVSQHDRPDGVLFLFQCHCSPHCLSLIAQTLRDRAGTPAHSASEQDGPDRALCLFKYHCLHYCFDHYCPDSPRTGWDTFPLDLMEDGLFRV